ncbi:MAG: insulinase family protein [Desulfovibrionaceae bacterium]|nr:insulinase family protein [Desulfovibrionaceae bacterium]
MLRCLLMVLMFILLGITEGYALSESPKVEQVEKNTPDEILTRLPNGLTVYIFKDTRFPLVLTRLYVQTGSANETLDQAGISHVLEHMVFKGTKLRPKGQVAKEVEALGGYLNAATSFDRTWYITDMPKEHWKTGLEVVYDMAFQAVLDPKELEAEKDVIVSELQGGEDNPGHKLFEELQTGALEHSVYGRPIIGYEPTIRKVTSEALAKYRDYWYQPENMQLLIAGDIDPKEVMEHVHKLFDHMQNTHSFKAIKPIDVTTAASEKRVVVKYGPWKKVYLGLGFPAPELKDIRSTDLDVLCYLLGGDGTSRFYKTYKYEQQLVESIDVGNMSLGRGGLLFVDVCLDVNKVEAFWEAFTKDLASLKAKDFSDDSLKRAILNLEDSFERAGETLNGLVGKRSNMQFLLGGPQAETNLLERIRGITREQLDKALKTWFDPRRVCVRVLAPQGCKLPDLAAILAKNWKIDSKDQALNLKLMQGEEEQLTLDNGCKIVFLPDTKAPYISLNWTILGGNALLEEKEQGLSHLTAALLSDGAGDLDAQGLERYLAERAGSLNCSSNRQTFSLKLEGPSKYTEDFLKLLNLLWSKPTFAAKEFDREQKNLLAALSRLEDQPLKYLFSNLRNYVYKNHCYGFEDLGTKESLSNFKVEDVKNYWLKQQKQPWVLSVAGSFNKEAMLDFAKNLAKNPLGKPLEVKTPELASPKELSWHLKGRSQAHLVKLFPTVPALHEDTPALMLLSSILSGQSGLLFSSMRDQEGLGYTVTAFTRSLPKTGWLVFYIGTVADKLKSADEGFKRTIEELIAKPLDPKLLENGVNRMRGSYVREHQKLESRAEEAAQNAILNYPSHFRKVLLDKAAKVTPEELWQVAKKYLIIPKAYTATLEP